MKIPKVTVQTTQGDKERERLMLDVLQGSGSSMDKDSLFAAATLLLEAETNKAVIRLLQTRELHGWLDAKGKVSLCVCGGSCDHSLCDHSKTTEAA